MADVIIKLHDTKGIFTDVLKLDGEPINLVGCTVSFLIKKTGTAIKRPATITQTAPPPDASAGGVQYELADMAAQNPPKGVYKQEWEVVFPDTQILTVPNQDWNTVTILDDLG